MKYKTRFLLFFVAMALFHLASNFAHPVTPTIIQALGLPDYMFGLMLAVMMIANFALSPSWGNINRFISSRQSLLICCVGYALTQLGFAYSTTQMGILFVRLLAGVFIGGAFVSMLTYVVNAARPEDMAKYLTYSATLNSVFGAFGYLVGGVVGEFSIRATFLLQAATLLVCGVLFRLSCAPDAERTEKASVKELLANGNPFDAFRDGKYFMNTAFVLLFLVNILINLGNTCFDQVFNYYLKDQLGLTSAYNGIIKAVVGFISFLFNMTLCLWIIRKADTGKSTVVLAGVCTLASLGTVFAPQTSVFLSCGIALYAGYSVSVPVLQDMVATRADPAQKNLVMGFYNATKSLGSIIGSLLAGFLYAIHIKLPFIWIATVYALSIAAAVGYLVYCRVGERAKC
ncbi:MAG TPA: MFS transporter [Clostridiales bacterium]|nr:MFS transporter [Clostridiales bacterium]HCP71502.1 MFS transporter [Clostridiales bacterium]